MRQNLDYSELELIIVSNFEIDAGILDSEAKPSSIVIDGTIGEFLYAGVKAAKFDLISFLDDDDIFMPGKLKAVREVFEENRGLCYYHNALEYFDKNLKPIDYVRLVERKSRTFSKNRVCVDIKSNHKSIKAAIDLNGDFNLSCISIRKETFSKYLPLLKQIKGSTDSFFFWSSAISLEQLMLDDRKFTGYRVHNLNVSGSINIEKKVKEINKQIYTYDLLLNLIGQSNNYDYLNKYLSKWVLLYKLEYILTSYIFQNVSRISKLKTLIELLKIGDGHSNALKFRISALSLISILCVSLAQKIYWRIKESSQPEAV
jgi:hypothetical protein